jgi:transmembrane sensor
VPAGLAAAVALALGGVTWWRAIVPAGHDGLAPFTTTANTEVGAQRALDLPDGSVVHLNTDSHVEVSFTPALRQVRLVRGEALFEVAKNRSRPFVVSTGSVQIRAVGTAFNVRLRSQAMEVFVTEGSVRVENLATPAAAPTRSSAAPGANLLAAGQKLTVDLTSPAPAPAIPETVPPAAVKRALAWQQQRLEFESAALPDMVAEFNRYSRHQLVIADPRLEQKRFGGSFPAGDHRTFVRLLETHFGVIAERRHGQTQLRLAP